MVFVRWSNGLCFSVVSWFVFGRVMFFVPRWCNSLCSVE